MHRGLGTHEYHSRKHPDPSGRGLRRLRSHSHNNLGSNYKLRACTVYTGTGHWVVCSGHYLPTYLGKQALGQSLVGRPHQLAALGTLARSYFAPRKASRTLVADTSLQKAYPGI